MRKIIIAIGVICVTSLFAQTHVETYRSLYTIAMEDSIITIEELSLLNALQASFGMEEDEILRIQQQWTLSEKQSESIIRNHEGRYWIIGQNMLLGNGLYGNAIPYILNIEDEKTYFGIQFLFFAGGFPATWMYTKEMDVSYGRAWAQNFGTTMGLVSAYPLIAMVGFENWDKIDPQGKTILTYQMIAAPIGAWQADRVYRKWEPTNGQAQLIIGGSLLGGFNTWGIYTLITDIPDEDPSENWFRVGIPLTYAGTLVGGYYTHKYVMNKPYTRGDASFVGLGTTVGAFCWGFLTSALNIEEYRTLMLLGLISINGYTYMADKLVQRVDLTTGDAGIVALGSVAGYLAWLGTVLLTDMDLSNDNFRYVDIASITAGFYFTFKAVSKHRFVSKKSDPSQFRLSFQPTIMRNAGRYSPGLNMTVRF